MITKNTFIFFIILIYSITIQLLTYGMDFKIIGPNNKIHFFDSTLSNYSKTIKNLMEDCLTNTDVLIRINYETEKTITLVLNMIKQYDIKKNKITIANEKTNSLDQLEKIKFLSNAYDKLNLEAIESAIRLMNFLEVPDLLDPLLSVWVTKYCKEKKINLKKTFEYPTSLPKDLYPYIEDHIFLQRNNLYVRKTISDLLYNNQMPQVSSKGILNFSNLQLTSLERLSTFDCLEAVESLDLSNNVLINLNHFPWDRFTKLVNLNLLGNKIAPKDISQENLNQLTLLETLQVNNHENILPILKVHNFYINPDGALYKNDKDFYLSLKPFLRSIFFITCFISSTLLLPEEIKNYSNNVIAISIILIALYQFKNS